MYISSRIVIVLVVRIIAIVLVAGLCQGGGNNCSRNNYSNCNSTMAEIIDSGFIASDIRISVTKNNNCSGGSSGYNRISNCSYLMPVKLLRSEKVREHYKNNNTVEINLNDKKRTN